MIGSAPEASASAAEHLQQVTQAHTGTGITAEAEAPEITGLTAVGGTAVFNVA